LLKWKRTPEKSVDVRMVKERRGVLKELMGKGPGHESKEIERRLMGKGVGHERMGKRERK
jgi:hypothetical protein